MFIELTDHLRCVAEHDESFLVLIPDRMDGRRVMRGILGCPVCQAEYRIDDGIADLGGRAAEPGNSPVPGGPDAPALLAFLGLEGPGGFLGLVGDAARFGEALGAGLPGVHLVAVNPPEVMRPASNVSVLQAPRMPLKARSLRGVVLGTPEGSEAAWQQDAVRAVLPGLRATGVGVVPAIDGFELLGAADGWWVGVRR
jgi:uncharacterized protein YbaR (Trm112 family)